MEVSYTLFIISVWLIYGLSMAFIRVILGFALRYDVYLCGNMEGADGKFAEGEGREGCSR